MEQDAPLPPFRTRIEVLFAARADKAVILRRGPRTHYQLIAWDLRSDTFTCGQWMKGLIRLCDLSLDGRMLIYWAAQYHPSAVERRLRIRSRGEGQRHGADYDPLKGGSAMAAKRLVRRGRKVPRYLREAAGLIPSGQRAQENTGTWTAVSPVPYFSALAIWPAFGHWTGGGIFAGDSRIVVFEPEDRMVPVVTVPIPERVHIQSAWSLVRSELARAAQDPLYDFDTRIRQRPPDIQARCDELAAALKRDGLRTIEWVHERGRDVLFAADGAIYRVPGGRALAPEAYVCAARKLIDLAPMRFELMRAPPEAMRWQP